MVKIVSRLRAGHMLAFLVLSVSLLVGCAGASSGALYVPDLVKQAANYNGKDVTVDGAYLDRDGRTLLALGVSTLDNGLDAQPIGDQPIWLEGFPTDLHSSLHQPGDAVYGFVRVVGRFETGASYGPDGSYKHRIQVSKAEAIEQVRRVEQRVKEGALGEGKVPFRDLFDNPGNYNGQSVTTQGYYFWNGIIFVLAEGVSTEEDGASPQPIGKIIWMEGFPPDESGKLNLGPNNSYVWGLVEVTGAFQGPGNFGKDGAYPAILNVTSAKALEPKK